MAFVCRLAGLALALLFSACASAPAPDPVTAPGGAPVPPVPPTPPKLAVPPVPDAFARLAPWSQAEIAPGLLAFKRSCRAITGRETGEWLAPSAPWAGRVGDWQPACAAMENAGDAASARTILETLFLPVEVMAQEGDSRFTGYFEPTIEARKQPVVPFTAPIPGPPQDMVRVGGRPMQRRPDGRLRPYPPRAQITAPTPIAYAHPADVFFLQIQGSGRLQFPDGASLRAVYHANNGHPFRSTANWLIRKGELSRGEASMQGIRAWMDRASAQERRSAMNANPRYVFFAPQPVGDPKLGPAGAAGQPLVALGSMAVDDRRHAYGVPYLVSTSAPGLGGEWSGLLVAQDTGGAIRGAVRGDIFFGTGERAGERAGTMNAPGRMWALLPRSVAERLARPARQTDDATS
ncbi:MAG: transglycosylase [Alphaproteobacteria bacterium]|jgi:membrane-bound lytic murein transglycosylase A|nr:transglycosylase [Alphaproteobacteria bacterium]